MRCAFATDFLGSREAKSIFPFFGDSSVLIPAYSRLHATIRTLSGTQRVEMTLAIHIGAMRVINIARDCTYKRVL